MTANDEILRNLENLYYLTGGAEKFQMWYRLSGLTGQGEESPDEVILYMTEDEGGMNSRLRRGSMADQNVADFLEDLSKTDIDGHKIINNGKITGLGQEWRLRTERGITNLSNSEIIDSELEETSETPTIVYPDTLRSIGQIYGVLGHEHNLEFLELIDQGSSSEEFIKELSREQYLESRTNLENNGFIEETELGEYGLSDTGQAVYEAIVKNPEGDYNWMKNFKEWYH